MKKTRFAETQIVKAIQEHDQGRDANNLVRMRKTAFDNQVHICRHI